jgi:exopolyphosphatase/pppGpp-phosphohydrolase
MALSFAFLRRPRSQPVDAPGPLSACPTRQALERWVGGQLGSVIHERRVAAIAVELFAATRPLHGLGPRDLRLLVWAAVVHDVGRAVCDETHPRDGADLIRRDATLPLTPGERRQLAFLTLYHKGSLGGAGRDPALSGGDDAPRMLVILALLRAADGLDNRGLSRKSHAPPRVEVQLQRRAGRRSIVRITCALGHDSHKARRVYGKRKKFRLLEHVLACDVRPVVVVPQRVRAVA